MKTFKFSYENLSNKNGQVWLVSNCNDSFSMDYLINGILPNFKNYQDKWSNKRCGVKFLEFFLNQILFWILYDSCFQRSSHVFYFKKRECFM